MIEDRFVIEVLDDTSETDKNYYLNTVNDQLQSKIFVSADKMLTFNFTTQTTLYRYEETSGLIQKYTYEEPEVEHQKNTFKPGEDHRTYLLTKPFTIDSEEDILTGLYAAFIDDASHIYGISGNNIPAFLGKDINEYRYVIDMYCNGRLLNVSIYPESGCFNICKFGTAVWGEDTQESIGIIKDIILNNITECN